MDQLKPLEDYLGKLFKSAPQMSASARKTLSSWMASLAIVFGILQLLAVYFLWHAGHAVNGLVDYANSLCAYTGCKTYVPHLGFMYYVALITLLVSAVTLLLAYPGLKAHKKSGWNWLFLGTLINLVYGVVSIFVDSGYGGGIGRLFSALVGSAISFYLLYQIRDIYTGHSTAAEKPAAPKA